METHSSLTDDLVEEILLRLPVRHLLRLRCLSKSWCALIDNTPFIRKHYQIQYALFQEEDDIPLFLASNFNNDEPSEFFILSKKQGDVTWRLTPDLDRDRVLIEDPGLFEEPNEDPDIFEEPSEDHDEPFEYPHLFKKLYCIGVVNGIVGFYWHDDYLGLWHDDYLGLWNPATRDFKAVPRPRVGGLEDGVDILGLGFDPKSNDFKIVTNMYLKEGGIIELTGQCEVYSVSTNSWTSIELPLPALACLEVNFPLTDAYYNGAYYWTGTVNDMVSKSLPRFVILSFDFSIEAFQCLDPPPAAVTALRNGVSCEWGDRYDWVVGRYKENLALIFSQKAANEICLYEIWVARKLDDGETSLSWQHLFTIRPHHGLRIDAFVAFRMDGNVLLNIGPRGKSKLYNPSTRVFKSLGYRFDNGYNYVESLFPLSKRQIHSNQDLN